MPFAAIWMDMEIIILREVSQRMTNIISFICGIKKYDTNELVYETDSQTERTDLWWPRGRDSGGGMD